MRQHPEKLPCRLFLFRYASKIAVANNYNKECRVLIENGDKDGEVPPDTIVEPCQISWLGIFASEFLLSKQSGCLSRCVFFLNSVATICNRKKKHKIHSTGVKCLVGSWCQLQDFVAEILGLQFWWADSPLGVVALPHPGSALWTLSFVTASPLQLAISHANASNNKNTAKKHQKPP